VYRPDGTSRRALHGNQEENCEEACGSASRKKNRYQKGSAADGAGATNLVGLVEPDDPEQLSGRVKKIIRDSSPLARARYFRS